MEECLIFMSDMIKNCLQRNLERNITTFQTHFGAMRLVILPMDWTNSIPIFYDEILKPEILDYTIPYIVDMPVYGPTSTYENEPRKSMIPENNGIRCFNGNICKM